jgi:hypothetical protein
VAICLVKAGLREDALEYAQAALRDFEAYGERAASEFEQTQRLIAKIRG